MTERPHVGEIWDPGAQPAAERMAGYRRTATEAVLLVGVVALGAVVVVAAVALLVLVLLNALLAGLVLAAALLVLAFRQGGLIALAAAAWHAVDRWRPVGL
jgi:hypothetical protein